MISQQSIERQIGAPTGTLCMLTSFYSEACRQNYPTAVNERPELFVAHIGRLAQKNEQGFWLRGDVSRKLREELGIKVVSWSGAFIEHDLDKMKESGYIGEDPEDAKFFTSTIAGNNPLDLVENGEHIIATVKAGFAANSSLHAVVLHSSQNGNFYVEDPDERNTRQIYDRSTLEEGLLPSGGFSIVRPYISK